MPTQIILRVSEAGHNGWEWEASIWDASGIIEHRFGLVSGLGAASELWRHLDTEWWDFAAPRLPLDTGAEV